MVRELQALALDIRVQDRNGNEVSLSDLGRDDDSPIRNKADADAIDEVLGRSVADSSLRDSFLFEDEDGNEIEEDEEEIYDPNEEDYAMDDFSDDQQ